MTTGSSQSENIGTNSTRTSTRERKNLERNFYSHITLTITTMLEEEPLSNTNSDLLIISLNYIDNYNYYSFKAQFIFVKL